MKILFDWIVKRRFLSIFITIVCVSAMAYGLRFIHQTYDYRIYFDPGDPELIASDALQKIYNRSDNVLIVLAPKSGKVFTQKNLRSLKNLTAEAWKTPYSIRVDSITNYQYSTAEGDTISVRDLIPNVDELGAKDLENLQRIATNEPELVNNLISPSAHVTGVNITVQMPQKDPDAENKQVVDFVRRLADQVRQENPELEVHLTGIVIMNNAFPEASEKDSASLIPAMFVLIAVVLWFMTRSIGCTVTIVLAMLMSIMSAIGLAGWLGIKVSPASAAAPVIIMTVVIADCVHTLSTYLRILRTELVSKREAIIRALLFNFKALLLTSATTALGFLTLNFAASPPFRDLGNITAMGVIIAMFISLSFMPAFVTLMPSAQRGKVSASADRRWLEVFADFVVKRHRSLFWGFVALSLILGAFVSKNELNDEFVKYFDESIEARRATEFTSDNLTGITNLEYSFLASGTGGVSDPEYLRHIERFTEWFRAQTETLHVDTITDTFKRLNQNVHGDDRAWYRLPEQRDLSAQYLLMYEMSLPFGLDLNNRINVDKSSTRVTVSLKNLTNNELLAVVQRAQDWMSAEMPGSMRPVAAGWAIMFAHIAERNISSMIVGIVLEMVGIALFLIIPLRSIKLGILSLVPNVLPGLLAFGIWGIAVGRIGLAASIIVSITLGIIVDDTIHFTSKFLDARRNKGMSAEAAAKFALIEVGEASIIMSLVLMAGFGVLSLSTFQVNSIMGMMSALTIFIGLLMEGLLLPPMLIMLERSPKMTVMPVPSLQEET
jgi:predicted RND superfamily exporter protein